ncbi:hypothetical protein LIER_16014 [Lithospermum erythrorhizon]|uniref:Uncharacterized protein n=1 Tax=Lithospermum erythrorhizon TaxID=34254 RepID=A0AAV3Q6I2_LITER
MALVKEHSYFCSSRKVISYYFALLFFTSLLINAYSQTFPISHDQFGRRRRMLDLEDEDFDKPIKKKSSSSSSTSSTSLSSKKNQTKLLIKPVTSSSKNQTKLVKSTSGEVAKNQTKLIKTTSDSTKNKTNLIKPTSDSSSGFKTQLKKLNSTSKSSNSTKSSTLLTKKPSDLTKTPSASKNKTTKPLTTTQVKTPLEDTKREDSSKKQSSSNEKPNSQKLQKKTQPSWFDQDDDDDFVAEFRDLPSKFQETLLPDLETISRTSHVYLTKYSKEITKNVKPIVGKKYASSIASFVSFAFIIIPLILVSLIFNKIKAYFSLQKLLIFIQIYLAIYFSILSLSSLVTGLEPLKFFYATSQSTYVGLQVLQTLAYVLYLLLLLMYLVLVFSTEVGPLTKLLGLGQTFVGFAVGLHYYMKVFHRAVLRQPPKTSWKVHALYATCFFVICLLANADRRKKAYLEEDGEEGKKN